MRFKFVFVAVTGQVICAVPTAFEDIYKFHCVPADLDGAREISNAKPSVEVSTAAALAEGCTDCGAMLDKSERNIARTTVWIIGLICKRFV